MSIIDWFAKKKAKKKIQTDRLNIPGELWVKCPTCSLALFTKDLEENLSVCECGHHFRISPDQRIQQLCDPKSFRETDAELRPIDFLEFSDTQSYAKRIEHAIKKNNANDAIVIGQATIKKQPINIGVMNFQFMGGSMGSVVGEKITRLVEAGLKNHHPVVLCTSSGGARMQEGILSLMQMAKTSAALSLLTKQRVPYISILCDPTTGGTSASFAMLGDVIIAEPKALISFAGPRVIEQTIRQKVPKGFQRSEFLLEKGFVDLVIERSKLRDELAKIVHILTPQKGQA